VNNRHLGSFVTDITLSHHLAEELMATRCECFISESGISDADTVAALRSLGYNGFLVGETFMKTADPADTLRRFIAAVEASERG
ncbi:MAG: indole-3-glycerol-phosphate synthase TrpC, partial [Prevotellaceae bacterium]|jgi:indole-3-glycerol phosphate synthase|nr:indole-3-glycerol-phosphate synthase TrpC [Prevotellaceae bacterium]